MENERKTFAEMLAEVPEPADDVAGRPAEIELLDPSGRPMGTPQRLTARRARPWVKRPDVPLGVLPCGGPIRWSPAEDRPAVAAEIRKHENADCEPAGDVLLFPLADGTHALALDDTVS